MDLFTFPSQRKLAALEVKMRFQPEGWAAEGVVGCSLFVARVAAKEKQLGVVGCSLFVRTAVTIEWRPGVIERWAIG
jgi:hypothetical protein